MNSNRPVSFEGKLLAEILEAWTNPGPVPGYHAQAQQRLRETWPALATKLDEAARFKK